jgi:hypothetical protein
MTYTQCCGNAGAGEINFVCGRQEAFMKEMVTFEYFGFGPRALGLLDEQSQVGKFKMHVGNSR